MKQNLRLLLLVFLLSVILAVFASADGTSTASGDGDVITSTGVTGGSVVFPSISGGFDYDKLSVSYSDTSNLNGTYYVVLVVKATLGTDHMPTATPAINKDTILYIDMVEKTESGLSFPTVYPRTMTDSAIYIAGSFATGTSPLLMGTLDTSGATLSGLVESYDKNTTFTATLYSAGTANAVGSYISTAESGSGKVQQTFSITGIASGTYDLVVTKNKHLTYKITGITVDEDLDLRESTNAAISKISLLCGDIDGNAMINNLDYAVVMNPANFNKSYTNPSDVGNVKADLDGNGMINNLDYAVVMNPSYFNKNTNNCTVVYVV